MHIEIESAQIMIPDEFESEDIIEEYEEGFSCRRRSWSCH
jgi:hypothetical protein